jgi:ABC-type oligopeptide transport system substrate-binding subunit
LAALAGFGEVPRYLQTAWREHLGVDVHIIENMPFEEIIAGIIEGSIQLGLIGYEIDFPDPDNILRVLFHSASPTNYFGWRNQQFDQWVDEAAVLSNPQERFRLYHQADRLLVAEETAIAPLYYWQGYGLLQPEFKIEGAGKFIRGSGFKFKNIRVV